MNKRFRRKLVLAKGHANRVKQKQELAKIYHSNDRPRKKPAFGKIGLVLAMIDFVVIQVFSMWFMATYPEHSDLGAFIGIGASILGFVSTLMSYYKKSTAENTVGGIVYETALQNLNDETEESVG